MTDRIVPWNLLLLESIRFMKWALLAGVLGVAIAGIFVAFGDPMDWATPAATFVVLSYFGAPTASASLRSRYGLKRFARGSSKMLGFNFLWGAVVVAAFIASLQIAQGMEATGNDYLLAMASGGAACAILSLLPAPA